MVRVVMKWFLAVLACGFLSTALPGQDKGDLRRIVKSRQPLKWPDSITFVPPGRVGDTPVLLTSTDLEIGDPTLSYVDPEFLPEERLVVWQDAAGKVWLCHVDPGTGHLIPPDGRGEFAGLAAPLLTKQNPFSDVTYNGPEFGRSQQGIVVYYCGGKSLDVTRYSLATRKLDRPLTGDRQNTRALISSKDASDPGVRVMLARFANESAGAGIQVINEWFDDAEPSLVHEIPRIKSGTSGPQWIPGERAIITQYPDDDGVQQVNRYDIDAGKFTQWTKTPGEKVDSFAFHAPEFPGELLFLTLTERKWLEVYRRQDADWVRILQIPSPGNSLQSSSGLKSAEPVFYQGRTYFTYLADGEKITRIAFASLDGRINTWISKAGSLDQFDPEGVAFEETLFVYYYEGVNAQNIQKLHRCQLKFWP